MNKWLKVSHDAGSTLIHDVIVHMYCFDCYSMKPLHVNDMHGQAFPVQLPVRSIGK